MSSDDRLGRALLVVAALLVAFGVWALFLRDDDAPDEPAQAPVVEVPGGPPGDPDRVPLEGFGEVAVRVDPGDGGKSLAWCLLAALEAEQRARGLMEVTDLQGYSGMAFVYPVDVDNGFYMRNTPTPLSIAWVREDGSVVRITDMEPCEDRDGCPTYEPGGSYRYAIEAFQGQLDDLGITEGATVAVGGECAARA